VWTARDLEAVAAELNYRHDSASATAPHTKPRNAGPDRHDDDSRRLLGAIVIGAVAVGGPA
jgi:hypothetical protein